VHLEEVSEDKDLLNYLNDPEEKPEVRQAKFTHFAEIFGLD
jgi:hypothetical protein